MHQQHTMDNLGLQPMGKALCHRIAISVTSTAHASDQPAAVDQIAMVPDTMKAATIRVHYTARLATPREHRPKRRADEFSVDARAHSSSST